MLQWKKSFIVNENGVNFDWQKCLPKKLIRETLEEMCLINCRLNLSALNVFTTYYKGELSYGSIKHCMNSLGKLCIKIMSFRRFLLDVLFKKVIELKCMETLH